MTYEIEYTEEATEDLIGFLRYEQNVILDGIDRQLRFEPTRETRNRKRLRPNSTASWELRLGRLRVLYDVETTLQIVKIRRVGEKRGSEFVFRGRRGEL